MNDTAPGAARWTTRKPGGWVISGGLLAVAVAIQLRGELNCDDSWFITFAERVLAGSTAYVDISDPNTPAAFLIYMPAVAVAAALHLKSEALVVLEVFVAFVASLSLTSAILAANGTVASAERARWRNAAILAWLVLPGAMFAEREHFAALAALPILTVYAVRAEGGGVRPSVAILAGLMAGCMLSIKPHFGAVLLIPALAVMLRPRSAAAMCTIENMTAVLAFAGFMASTAIWFPAYFTVAMPDVVEVYARCRDVMGTLGSPATLFILLLYGVFAYERRRGGAHRADIFVFASAGFFIAYLVQAKMTPDHAMPAIIFGVFGLLLATDGRVAVRREPGRRFQNWVRLPLVLLAAIFTCTQVDLLRIEAYPGLTAALARLPFEHVKMASIAEAIYVPFPAVRHVNGIWVGRQNALWRANNVEFLLSTSHLDDRLIARLRAIADRDRADLAADIETGKPDVILVESAEVREKSLQNKALARAMEGYCETAEASGIEIWARPRANTAITCMTVRKTSNNRL